MRGSWLRRKRRQRVVVYTTEEHVLDGLLVSPVTDGVVLADVRVRSDNDVHLAGEVYVPREKVRFVQIVAASGR